MGRLIRRLMNRPSRMAAMKARAMPMYNDVLADDSDSTALFAAWLTCWSLELFITVSSSMTTR
ncbi:hypothetical protein D9M69_713760 [compost metagenome]